MLFRNLGIPELILMVLCCGVLPLSAMVVGVVLLIKKKSKEADERTDRLIKAMKKDE
jgi:hypothetical protein